MPHANFQPPVNVIEKLRFLDYDIYVAPMRFQATSSNYNRPNFYAVGVNSEGKKITVGDGKGSQYEFTTPGDALKEMIKKVRAAPPKTRYDRPIPDYRGFKMFLSGVPDSKQVVSSATRGGLVVEVDGTDVDRVLNKLRLKVDRYVDMDALGEKTEESSA